MSDLNLPKEFWSLWNFIQRSFENKTVRHQGEIKDIFITVEKALTALSDARNREKELRLQLGTSAKETDKARDEIDRLNSLLELYDQKDGKLVVEVNRSISKAEKLLDTLKTRKG